MNGVSLACETSALRCPSCVRRVVTTGINRKGLTMASGIVAVRRGDTSRRDRPSYHVGSRGPMQGLGWTPAALGTAAVVAVLGNRRKGTLALALAAFAGVVAVEAVRRMQRDRGQANTSRNEPKGERSITIGKTADELRDCWRTPGTLSQIMAGLASVREIDDRRMHWKVKGPLGRAYEWDSETVDDADGGIGWRSLPDAAFWNEGSLRFRPAPGNRGTVATLAFRFDPPGGAIGDAAVRLFGTTPLDVAAERALRRFKSLVETGEIPTTERQPAARADTH